MSFVAVIMAFMTELSYMTREDWGQNGTATKPQSALIRKWLGRPPILLAVTDVKKFNANDRDADYEAAGFIDPSFDPRKTINISDLPRLGREGQRLDRAVVLLHPFDQSDLEALSTAVRSAAFSRMFVLVWSPRDNVRAWLDGLGAMNLHTGEALPQPDPLLLAAAESMIEEEYNGLSSGRGKDAVVQLVRALSAEGYPVEVDAWLRAYFAAGGSFRHAESIAKLVGEIKAGKQHRVQKRYVDNIADVHRSRIASA